MNGEIVRIVAYNYLPYVHPCVFCNDKRKCPQPGIEISLIQDQLICLGFQPKFIRADNYTHMKYMLETNAADISGISDTVQDAGNLSVTLPLIQSKLVFLVGRSQSSLTPSLLFYQCDWRLWLTVTVGLLVCFSFKTFHGRTLKLVRTIERTDFSGKFPMIAWGLCFVVFSSLYSNNLAITLALRRTSIPFNNLDELTKMLDQDRCRFVLTKFDHAHYKTVKTLTNELGLPQYYANNLLSAISKADVFDFQSEVVYLTKITEKECRVGLAFEMAGAIWESLNDKIFVIKMEELTPLTFVYYMNPSFKSRHEKRLAFLNSGSISNLYETYFKKILEENRHRHGVDTTFDRQNLHEHNSLKMQQLCDTFYVLFCGMVVGVVTFLFALVKAKIKI